MSRVVIFDEPGGPGVLRVVDEQVREPGPGEVSVKVEAIGVNRLDQMIRAGFSPRPIRFPHARLGVEATGVVGSVGAGVDPARLGEAVIITAVPDMDVNGTYAEDVVVPANRAVPRPAGLDPIAGAALWVAYSTAYGALIEKAGMRPADTVLITAASSGVGLAAIQVANQIGAVPIAVTRHAAKRDALRAAGATAVVVTDDEDVAGATHALAGGAGVDIILDSVMGPGLADLAQAAKSGGTLVLVGWLDPRPVSFPAGPLTVHRYMSFEHTLDDVAVLSIAAFLGADVRTGVLRPTIDKVFDLDAVVDAHRYLELGQQVGKIVLAV